MRGPPILKSSISENDAVPVSIKKPPFVYNNNLNGLVTQDGHLKIIFLFFGEKELKNP
jgi:hypothetical protein